MIERKRLVLKQVTTEEYLGLKAAILQDPIKRLLTKRLYQSEKNPYGFAKIEQPLVYSSFKELLEHAKETPDLRKVSVRRPKEEEYLEKWFEVGRSHLNTSEIEELVIRAIKQDFLWLAFNWTKSNPQGRINNEILFHLVNYHQVQSRFIEIPGIERDLYTWKGEEQDYPKIIGILPYPI